MGYRECTIYYSGLENCKAKIENGTYFAQITHKIRAFHRGMTMIIQMYGEAIISVFV